MTTESGKWVVETSSNIYFFLTEIGRHAISREREAWKRRRNYLRKCDTTKRTKKGSRYHTGQEERKVRGNFHLALLHLGVFLKEIIKSLCQVVRWQDFPEENRFGTIGSSNGVINQYGSPQYAVDMLI